jgi:hypothetical protein
MKHSVLLWLSLPLLALSCSEDDDGSSVGAGGTSGAGGSSGGGMMAGSAGDSGGGSAGSAGSSQSGAGGGMPSGGSGGSSNGGSSNADAASGSGDEVADDTMTFFVTSAGMGDGGNLGGLEGADAFCRQLAVAVDADFARRTWRAYLSTTEEDAGERIGTGPWHNQAGDVIANDLAQLHDQAADGALDDTWPPADLGVALDEQGNQVMNNVHDILTGTQENGTLAEGSNCDDWTSNVADAANMVTVGHSNRNGGGRPPSWTSAHEVGCSQNGTPNVTQGGGRGSIYCFAVITSD